MAFSMMIGLLLGLMSVVVPSYSLMPLSLKQTTTPVQPALVVVTPQPELLVTPSHETQPLEPLTPAPVSPIPVAPVQVPSGQVPPTPGPSMPAPKTGGATSPGSSTQVTSTAVSSTQVSSTQVPPKPLHPKPVPMPTGKGTSSLMSVTGVPKPAHVPVPQSSTVTTTTMHPGQATPAQAVPAQEKAAPQELVPQAWRQAVIIPEGITTRPEDRRGNWYDKRQILNQARTAYEQIRERIAKIENQEQSFLNRQHSLDKQIAAFYLSIGFEEGTVDTLLTKVMNELEQDRVTEGQLTEEERRLLAEVEEKKKVLQELRDDVSTLNELEAAVDKTATTVLEQIELCRSYEQKAWNNYEKIDNVLNEKIAQQLYLEMQSFVDHTTAVDTYLRTTLTQYVEQTAQSIRTYMQKIQADVDDLQQRGIALSAQAIEEEKAAVQARQKAEEDRKEREKAPVAPPKRIGWWERVSIKGAELWQTVSSGVAHIVAPLYERLFNRAGKSVVVPLHDTVTTKT